MYPRLNAALRTRDERILGPFLPYMKLLLSALYHLPLTQVPTYRGVKLELYEVRVSYHVSGICLVRKQHGVLKHVAATQQESLCDSMTMYLDRPTTFWLAKCGAGGASVPQPETNH